MGLNLQLAYSFKCLHENKADVWAIWDMKLCVVNCLKNFPSWTIFSLKAFSSDTWRANGGSESLGSLFICSPQRIAFDDICNGLSNASLKFQHTKGSSVTKDKKWLPERLCYSCTSITVVSNFLHESCIIDASSMEWRRRSVWSHLEYEITWFDEFPYLISCINDVINVYLITVFMYIMIFHVSWKKHLRIILP